MRIGFRIGAGFAGVVTLTLVLGATGWLALERYSDQVSHADRVAEIERLIRDAQIAAGSFRISGDATDRDDAFGHLDEAAARADAVDQPATAATIVEYRRQFDTLVAARTNADRLIAEIQSNTVEFERLAGNIRRSQDERRAELNRQRDAAQADQSEKLQIEELTRALILATLSARRDEAVYLRTRDPADASAAREATKAMFLTAIKLKKLTTGSDAEKPVALLAAAVGGYRKALESLVSTVEANQDVTAAVTELETVSKRINAFAAALARKETAAYEKARAMADAATADAEAASDITTLAADLVTAVKQVDVNIREVVAANGEGPAVTGQVFAFGTLERLVRQLAERLPDSDSIGQFSSMVEDGKARFDQLVEALRTRTTAAEEMTVAAEAVADQVGASVAASIAARTDDKTLSTLLILAGTAAAALLAVVLAVFLGRGITHPLRSITGAMERLADNDLQVDIPGVNRKDEIADIARCVQVFKDNAQRVRRLEKEQEEADARAEAEKRRSLDALAASFEESVGKLVEGLTSQVADVRARAEAMANSSTASLSRADAVAISSEQSTANVKAVSEAAEELASASAEIGSQVARAAEMARGASTQAGIGNERIVALADTATRIGAVIALIQEIAEQTNLLALNATIEAARAGDAGKGFAVVASEVKNLATQTAKATDDIRQQIEQMQGASGEAVKAIETIAHAVAGLDEMNAAVAAAVDEQAATTSTIAGNSQDAAAQTLKVSSEIAEVSDASRETGRSAEEVLSTCNVLEAEMRSLEREVGGFVQRIRAG
ncbi:methyl-accepting chemotaxis protein [Thalassobaculum sp. OXR-137]|uniref:methyl-accepting chemotaxis protein n=1 Tax=Thalassobaculum sp. OXR-137 TaxID=3100173 RepID=UPI002AC961C9|nr:methyl-accepting chemotaxis protein [Thalassobaculum sp. OXR-137]WPZ36783.1 methyl-accepting chemotaxis protein [Thalassobaculum sp. OXR-137]